MIDKPGIYPNINEAVYHADPVHVPSLSSSLAKVLVSETPAHAFRQHPRLSEQLDDPDTSSRIAEIGSAAHKIMLNKGAEIVVIDAEDYRKKEVKEQREAAINAKKIPILGPDFDKASALANRAIKEICAIPGCEEFFQVGLPECVLVWQDVAGPWCRSMLDKLDAANGIIWDIKTTAAGLSDRALQSRISEGYDLSAAFYVRGLSQLAPDLAGRIKFRWIFIEQDEPHEIRVIEADNTTLHMGDRKAAFALEIWRRCMESGDWPGYPRQIDRLDYAPWAESRWIERELQDEETAMAAVRMDSPVERTTKPLTYGG